MVNNNDELGLDEIISHKFDLVNEIAISNNQEFVSHIISYIGWNSLILQVNDSKLKNMILNGIHDIDLLEDKALNSVNSADKIVAIEFGVNDEV